MEDIRHFIQGFGYYDGRAILIDIVIFSIQGMITGEAIMRQEYLYNNLLYLIGAGAVVILVTLIRPLYMVFKISPAEGTRNF